MAAILYLPPVGADVNESLPAYRTAKLRYAGYVHFPNGGTMKKRIAILIVLVFCLSGCAFSAQTPEVTQAVTIHQTEATEPVLEVTEPTNAVMFPTGTTVQSEPENVDFVKVKAYIPDIVVELRYSTQDNFTQKPIYDFNEAWLRYGTVKKLICVQEELRQSGLCLKIWDGFRPPSAQFKLWEICPDPTYVSDPNKGFSSHSRGNTVDVTLVDADGAELVMPTGFDDFSQLADRDYGDCSEKAAENALFLEKLMTKHGFKPYSGEWWHFSDTNAYPVENTFMPIAEAAYYAECDMYISLRAKPSTQAEVLTRIPAGAQLCVVGEYGEFALVQYEKLTGYVLLSYIRPANL